MPGPTWSADRALYALLDALDEAALLFDGSSRCRAAGRRAGELLGVSERDLIGATRVEVLRRAMTKASDTPAFGPLADATIGVDSVVLEGLALAGRHVTWTSVPIVEGGELAGRIDILRDVTGQQEIAKKLEEVSFLDELTGLVNKKRFEHETDREHRRAQRAWAPYAIARLDVDGMARFNAAHGQALGDDLLRKVGAELKSARREYDLVGRWSTDEFIVLLPGADPIAAKIVVKRAVKGVHARLKETFGDITVCVGAAIWTPPSAEGAADVIRRAGDALASARERGPGSIEIDAGLGQGWKDDLADG